MTTYTPRPANRTPALGRLYSLLIHDGRAHPPGTLHMLFLTCPSLVCVPSAPSLPAVTARRLSLACFSLLPKAQNCFLVRPRLSPLLTTTVHRLPTDFATNVDPFPLRTDSPHRFVLPIAYGRHGHLLYIYRRLCVNPAFGALKPQIYPGTSNTVDYIRFDPTYPVTSSRAPPSTTQHHYDIFA